MEGWKERESKTSHLTPFRVNETIVFQGKGKGKVFFWVRPEYRFGLATKIALQSFEKHKNLFEWSLNCQDNKTKYNKCVRQVLLLYVLA